MSNNDYVCFVSVQKIQKFIAVQLFSVRTFYGAQKNHLLFAFSVRYFTQIKCTFSGEEKRGYLLSNVDVACRYNM